MSSGGSQSGNSSSYPQIPPYIQQLLRRSERGWAAGLNAGELVGGLPSLLDPHPEEIAGLTRGERGNIDQLEGWAQTGTPGEQQAFNQLGQLTSGPIGSSPDTIAAMNQWRQTVSPTISSAVAQSGGRGGALAEAMGQSETAAAVPLYQQEIANREAAVGQYANLGAQREQDVSNAMSASDLIRQIQQSQYTSNFQDYLRRSGLMQDYIEGPLKQFGGQAIGSHTTQNGTTSGGK